MRKFIETGISIPRNEDEVRKEVLAECGYSDEPIPNSWTEYLAAMAETGPEPERDPAIERKKRHA